MAHIKTNWLLAGMSGKACKHDDIYTKTNRQTGKSYAVKLCNPVDGSEPTLKQSKQRTKFGAIAAAVAAWIMAEKAKENGDGSVAYNKALAAYKGQHQYGSLRGYITAKYVAYNEGTGEVTITVGGSTSTVTPTNPDQGTETQNPGSNTSGSGGGSGDGIDYGGQGYM